MNGLLLAALLAGATPTETLGFLPSALPEASGMARSHRYPGAVWLINDGDHPAALHRIFPGQNDNYRNWPVDNVSNRDWESVASYQQDGSAWLAVADVGDNDAVHQRLMIALIREPDESSPEAHAQRVLAVELPDGPMDIEAIAVDANSNQVLLITKRSQPPRVYSVALNPTHDNPQVAREIARLTQIPSPIEQAVAADPHMGRWLSQPTGADLSPDGLTLALLTYDCIYLFRRHGQTAWSEVLALKPFKILNPVRLPQQEAIAFLSNETLLITTEKQPAPLLALQVLHE